MSDLQHLALFGAVMIATWLLVTYLWPRLLLYGFYKRGIARGLGEGPVPVNTLYTEPQALFADPLRVPAGRGALMAGTNRDTLYVLGWLDLAKGPLVLRVPDMRDRYYSVQLTDPAKNTNFAYVGTRATGTKAGEYLITGPRWQGDVPSRMVQVASPNNAVLVVGRVFVENVADLPAAHALSTQIQLTPF